MKILPSGSTPPFPKRSENHDALSPYTDALRSHFPSREEILREAKQQTRRQRALKKISTCLAFTGLLAGSWLWDPVLHREMLHTEVGQQASVVLKDGSRVALNTNTTLIVEQHLYSRQLHLPTGEALFNVRHAWRPLTVYAHQAEIRDIGTVFNVRNTAQGAVVTVIEGLVEVRTPGARQRVAQHFSVSVDEGKISAIRPASAASATLWQQGRLMFDGTSLAEVAAELQRYRRGRIEIADPRVAHYQLSGEFDIRGIDTLLQTLPDIMPVRITRQADGTVLIKPRN